MFIYLKDNIQDVKDNIRDKFARFNSYRFDNILLFFPKNNLQWQIIRRRRSFVHFSGV